MAIIKVDISDKDKEAFDSLLKVLEMDAELAINIFIKECIKQQKIPFDSISSEADVIMEELKSGKRKGYTDIDSLFKALDE